MRSRARSIEQHGGETPHDRAALEALPGVGRKTANVVLNTAFGEPTLAVDTHVFRVANRLGIAPGNTPREVEDELMRVVPEQFLRHAHHWLILHGRYVCKARKPLCGACVLLDICPYEPKTTADASGGKSKAPEVRWYRHPGSNGGPLDPQSSYHRFQLVSVVVAMSRKPSCKKAFSVYLCPTVSQSISMKLTDFGT